MAQETSRDQNHVPTSDPMTSSTPQIPPVSTDATTTAQSSPRVRTADSGTQTPRTPTSLEPITIPPRPLSDITSVAGISIAESTDDGIHTGKSWASSLSRYHGTLDAWLPVILTLDGGGIRGYSSLLILQFLMEKIAYWENCFEKVSGKHKSEWKVYDWTTLQPCLYFDFMYGTSTGGLIATMLGRLRMTVPVCQQYYREVGDKLFGVRRSRVPLATKYNHEPLEQAVQDVVKKYCPKAHRHTEACKGDDWHPWHFDEDGNEPDYHEAYNKSTEYRLCHSICLTAIHNRQSSEAYLLRTYDHQYPRRLKFVTDYNTGAEKLRIWQVTRATSAAPFYFKSLIADIEEDRREYKDGGIRENNPSTAAWSEFMSLYGCDGRECNADKCNAVPALLLSIGTGRPSGEKDGFPESSPYPFGNLALVRKVAEVFATVNHMRIKYTEGESKHAEMLREAQGMHSWYKRLNVDKGLENMGLDSWERGDDGTPGGKTLKRIEELTGAYLKRGKNSDLKEYAAPRDMLDQAAQKCVRVRRERERLAREGTESDRRRWEHFTGQHL